MKAIASFVLAAAAVTLAAPASAQFAKPEDAVKMPQVGDNNHGHPFRTCGCHGERACSL